jgi:molecular chaperone DnaK
VSRAELYYTVDDQQPKVDVQVYQGESPYCRKNTLIGAFEFPLKPAPANSPVTVEFAYDREGIVHVSVDQKGYNNSKSVTLNVRQKTLQTESEAEGLVEKPVNYISEKARRILADERLPQELKDALIKLTGKYEQAVLAGDDDALIDELEDQLLEKIEQAEEGFETIG